MEGISAAFEAAMWDIYKQALAQHRYDAKYFKELLAEVGGYDAAIRLAGSPVHHEGLTRLHSLGALHLSCEALVLQPQYRELFPDMVLSAARRKLQALGYDVTE